MEQKQTPKNTITLLYQCHSKKCVSIKCLFIRFMHCIYACNKNKYPIMIGDFFESLTAMLAVRKIAARVNGIWNVYGPLFSFPSLFFWRWLWRDILGLNLWILLLKLPLEEHCWEENGHTSANRNWVQAINSIFFAKTALKINKNEKECIRILHREQKSSKQMHLEYWKFICFSLSVDSTVEPRLFDIFGNRQKCQISGVCPISEVFGLQKSWTTKTIQIN